MHRIGHGLAGFGIDDAENIWQQMASRIFQPPPAEAFSCLVHAGYPPLGIGSDHTVANGMKRNRKTLLTFPQAGFRSLTQRQFLLLAFVGKGQRSGPGLDLSAQAALPKKSR